MKKNGFTLIELLAAIMIIAILALVAVPSVLKINDNIKIKSYCEKKDMVIIAAKNYGNDNLDILKSDCYREITIKSLVDNGYIKKENDSIYLKNPYDNSVMDNIVVKVYLKNNRAYAWYSETSSILASFCDESVSGRPTVKC